MTVATTLTYSGFATVLPDLADSTYQTEIEEFLNQAELFVNRAFFGATIPSTSTISRADLAVYLYAGHLQTIYLRTLNARGQAATGQVTSHSDQAKTVTYAPIATTNASDAALATTPAGVRFLQLRASIGAARLPLVT